MNLLFRLWPGESRPRLVSPLPSVRTAIVTLDPVFRHSGPVRYLNPDDAGAPQQLSADRPAILAGSHAVLTGLAERLQGSGPTHAIVVLTNEAKLCLTEAQRDELWRQYGVPIFEQVITAEGRLLAWECEAHDGLHLTDCAQPPARAQIESAPCDCGAESPRALGLDIAPRSVIRKSAASLLIPARLRSSQPPIAM